MKTPRIDFNKVETLDCINGYIIDGIPTCFSTKQASHVLSKSRSLRSATAELGCSDEVCVAKKTLPRDELKVFFDNLKHPGPKNSLQILSNFDIDGVLHKWEKHCKKKFKHHSYQMIDFMKYSDSIAYNDFISESKKYDCAACVFNTDLSTGRGLHWFCMFFDYSGHGRTNGIPNKVVIEHFNSSGRYPRPQIVAFILKLKKQFSDAGIQCEDVTNTLQHQSKNTECGVYCLFYIWSRLFEGVEAAEFNKPDYKVTDDMVTRFRKVAFAKSDFN